MSEDDNYAPNCQVTPERIVASLLVVVWVVVAFRIGALPLALRAVIVFLFPLLFVWIPELMARIAGVADKKSLSPDVAVLPQVIRWIGWFVIVGVPVSWWIMARAATVTK